MKRYLYLVCAILMYIPLKAQVGIGTTTPNKYTALHIKDNDKGLLIPVAPSISALPDGTDVPDGLLLYVDDQHAFAYWDSANASWHNLAPFEVDRNNKVIELTPELNTLSGNFKAKGDNQFEGNGAVPVGGIIMWSGTTIPEGWALCDGSTSNGMITPDLRGRFVVGYGADQAVHNGSKPSNDIWDSKYTNPGNLSQGGIMPGLSGNNSNTYKISANNLPPHWHLGKSYGEDDGKHNHLYKDSYYAEKTDIAARNKEKDDRVIGFFEPLGGGTENWYGSKGGFDTDNNALLTFYRNTYNNALHDWSGNNTVSGGTVLESWPEQRWRIPDTHHHTIKTTSTKVGSSTTSADVSNSSIDKRPPYYVLAFIIRTK